MCVCVCVCVCVRFLLVRASVGPLAKDVDSLALCMQALLSDHMFTLDPTVPPIPFNTEVSPLPQQVIITQYRILS